MSIDNRIQFSKQHQESNTSEGTKKEDADCSKKVLRVCGASSSSQVNIFKVLVSGSPYL